MTTEQTDINLQDGFFRKHAKYQAAKMSENIQAIKVVFQLWRVLVHMMSYPGYILLRRNFGERFLPTRVILVSSLTCLLVAMASQSGVGITIAIVMFVTACLHRIKIMLRNRRQEIWHSYDQGTSLIAEKFPSYTNDIEEFWEPAAVFAAGFVITAIESDRSLLLTSPIDVITTGAFGIYVMCVGAAMLLQANKLKRDARNLYLDARDSQIDNQAFAAIQDRDMKAMDSDSLFTQAGIARTA